MSAVKRLPKRSEVALEDTWDLSSLFADADGWEAGLRDWEARIPRYAEFQGRLGDGPATILACFDFDSDFDRLGERIAAFAYLSAAGDQTNSEFQRMVGRYQNIATKAAEAASFIQPELLSLPAEQIAVWLEDPLLAPYRLQLERLLRYQPHTLSAESEQLLAMQGEMSGAAGKAFRKLLDADLTFGSVADERGDEVELTNANFIQLLHSPDREVRRTAFHQYYEQFAGHENTLAATLEGSIHKDVYYARARRYASAREMALFPDNMPIAVYDNLISAVRDGLPALYEYFDVRRRKMGLDAIHHYDTYAPILSDLEVERTWDEAVDVVIEACRPLGEEYCDALAVGLRGRWCDRFPNKGKQSGAFSYGCFDGDPYILMNYQPRVLNQVFTLAHEAGHSMHSFYSSRSQPFPYYKYTIFVAEVASTFNEQLLMKHLLDRTTDDRQRAYLINRELDDIRATIYRQTMFAEFEKEAHALAEAGEPLTVDALRGLYRGLLNDYFGPDFAVDDCLSLECFRIPHFYRAFYVYKYATGMSAAIALSRRVLAGGAAELEQYLSFLKGGCSQDPLDLLRDAGVDMTQPEPVQSAVEHFAGLVRELDRLL